MELNTWLSEQPRSIGRCRYCGVPYANVPDEEGALPDTLLEEREILWGFTPLLLTLEHSHLPSSAGEWCGWVCLEADLSRYFELKALDHEIDGILSRARAALASRPAADAPVPLAQEVKA